jgi:hypothetical protein
LNRGSGGDAGDATSDAGDATFFVASSLKPLPSGTGDAGDAGDAKKPCYSGDAKSSPPLAEYFYKNRIMIKGKALGAKSLIPFRECISALQSQLI